MKTTQTPLQKRNEEIKRFFVEECLPLLDKKGADYSELDDPNSNFYEAAEVTGCDWKQTWFLYFFKHYTALRRWVKFDRVESESLDSRIADMVNYLLILHTMRKK